MVSLASGDAVTVAAAVLVCAAAAMTVIAVIAGGRLLHALTDLVTIVDDLVRRNASDVWASKDGSDGDGDVSGARRFTMRDR